MILKARMTVIYLGAATQLGGRWSFRFDKDLTNHDEEAGLLYRLHEYVGLEYIISGHDTLVRVIGYL